MSCFCNCLPICALVHLFSAFVALLLVMPRHDDLGLRVQRNMGLLKGLKDCLKELHLDLWACPLPSCMEGQEELHGDYGPWKRGPI